MKYAWIDAQRKMYPLPAMCETLAVSVERLPGVAAGGSPDRKRLTDAQLLALIKAIHAELKGAYGSPRMVRELRGAGLPASKPRVERLMRENGIRARHKRRYKATTDSKHTLPVAANLLDPQLQPDGAQSGVVGRHHLHLDRRGLAVPGRGAGSVQPRDRGLVDQAPDDGGHRDRCADDGVVPPPAGAGADPSLRPGQPVRQPRLPGQAHRVRHDLLDEPQGQLLGQRTDRELLQQLEERTGARYTLRNSR